MSSPSNSSRTLLLRVYGPSSGALIPRLRELQVLHVLSSKSKLGPRIYGTFTNGRIEEYFDSVTLTATDIREPQISACIGARMAELHGVDLKIIEGHSHGSNIEIGVRKNVQSWLPHARDVLGLPAITPAIRKELDPDRFQIKWESYMRWLKAAHVDAHPVLCHNDAQYGNILRLNSVEGDKPEHQVRLVSFISSPLRDTNKYYPYNRLLLSTLSTHPRTQPPSISRTTSTNGQPITTDQHHTYSTPHVTQLMTNDAPSLLLTSRTALASRPLTRLSTCQRPSSQNILPRRASERLSRSRMPYAHGVLHHMPCGRYGASSRRARTFWCTLPSLTLIILVTPAAAWPRSIASSPHLACKVSLVPSSVFLIPPFPKLPPLSVN